MADRTGGRTLRVDGAVLADLNSPHGYDNAVVLTRPPDAAGLDRVLVEGCGPDATGGSAVADPRLTGDLLHLVVEYADGEPVATAGASVRHGIVEIDWVAVPQRHRRRGYGTASTAAACAVAPDLPTLLISSDDGHPG